MITRNIVKYLNFARKYGVRSYCTSKSRENSDATNKSSPEKDRPNKRRKFVYQDSMAIEVSPELWKKLKNEGIITARSRLKRMNDPMQRLKMRQILVGLFYISV